MDSLPKKDKGEVEEKDDSRYRGVFNQLKEATLGKEDLSRKGSIDEPIRSLVEYINQNSSYYTTSTCSGRITLTEKPYDNAGIKKGNIFHLNNHSEINQEQFIGMIEDFWSKQSQSSNIADEEQSNIKVGEQPSDVNHIGCLWLKFEPFIMHIQCYNLEKARILLNLALASGCRNSGITLGKPNKFMLAIRNTSSMEVPLCCGTRFQQPHPSYYQFLCEEANRRFRDNTRKLIQLEETIREVLK